MVDLDQIREGLREVDIAVHNSWKLGKNMVVGWMADASGLQVCLAPCYRVLGQATATPRMLHGRRMMDARTFEETCKNLKARPLSLSLPFKIGTDRAKGEVDPEAIDSVIRRYSIVQTEYRAVILFDIVGFSKVEPIEQVAQLNSLEYSINNAAKKMGDAGFEIELARSTVGDGFYVWNRARGLEADLRTYATLLLILVDNALARHAAGETSKLVPRLRACFSVGSHYSYHQVEGTKPRGFEYIVGDVTITLARMISKAQAEQILVGNFQRPLDPVTTMLDPLLFIARADKLFSRLTGTVIGEHAIQEIRSLVTSGTIGGKTYPAVKYVIEDKHGYHHEVFNLRGKAKREDAEPIELGLRPEQLATFEAKPAVYEIPLPADGPRVIQKATS
ncbi:MAG TPA: hypothetical protein VGB82_24015 [Alphaproteobacteria bacterium]